MAPSLTASSTATEPLAMLTQVHVEDRSDTESARMSGLAQEIVSVCRSFATTFLHRLPIVPNHLEAIKSLASHPKQTDEGLTHLEKEFEQDLSVQKATIVELQQELFHAQEDLALFSQLSSDVRCRQLVKVEPLLPEDEDEVAKIFGQDHPFRKSGDLGAHGAQIKVDLILADQTPTFRNHIEIAYEIDLAPMLSLFNVSREARRLQTHRVKIHSGSLHLIQACIEHIFHLKMLLVDPSEDLKDRTPAALSWHTSGSFLQRVKLIKSLMSTESRDKFDGHVEYNTKYSDIQCLLEDARKHYMEYADKVHWAVQGRYSDLYNGAVSGTVNDISAEQLNEEWWKDLDPLSVEAVNILRHLILAVDCIFKPWANVSKGRVWPPQTSWKSAQQFYSTALARKEDLMTEAIVGEWESAYGEKDV